MKTVIELDRKLREGEVLVYKEGKLHGVNIRDLLPELKDFVKKDDLEPINKSLRELRGEE